MPLRMFLIRYLKPRERIRLLVHRMPKGRYWNKKRGYWMWMVILTELSHGLFFVKNLSFKTSDEALKRHFSEKMKEGRILKATGTILDGHALILQPCQVKKDERVLNKDDKHRSSTKLRVKNVAFEATKKDLEKLFSPFGKIKRVSLPRKYGNQKGYAFVECVTKQEGRNALQALANSHLYGRHLVLEWAKEGESLEELHARTAARFNDENGYSTAKLSKKRKQHMAVSDQDKMMFKRIAAG